MTGKIQALHLERRACVYVRQSTTTQVLENAESTARQYALVERARSLGWSEDTVQVIDEDLGRSAATAGDRSGFLRLAEDVARGEVGAIFAVEVSRLARSSQDWQRLLALCTVAQVVVADEHAIYDPQNADDKLLLDFKGTMSEAELHWLVLRMAGARLRMAKRGALHFPAPTGYVWGEHGFEMDPDEAVCRAIRTIFERFAVEPTAHAVVRWARRAGFTMPTRRSYADGTNELVWNPLGVSRVKDILRSPIYAGAYAYGRRAEKKVLVDGEIRTVRQSKGRADWQVLIQGAHPGYVTWETYLKNVEKLRENAARHLSPGAPRNGSALLSGILVCGRCGRRMRTTYQRDERCTYICNGEQDRGGPTCWLVSGGAIDTAVEELLLRMIVPGELELTLAVEREVEAQAASLNEQWRLRLEKAEYEARRAERRYKAVDPENRIGSWPGLSRRTGKPACGISKRSGTASRPRSASIESSSPTKTGPGSAPWPGTFRLSGVRRPRRPRTARRCCASPSRPWRSVRSTSRSASPTSGCNGEAEPSTSSPSPGRALPVSGVHRARRSTAFASWSRLDCSMTRLRRS